MKKLIIKISSLILVVLMTCAFAGCSFLDDLFSGAGSKPKLSTPQVNIGDDGVAVWADIDNAAYYVYVINDGDEKIAGGHRVQLSENQTIKVKAVSGSDEYADSDFSAPKTYKKNDSSGGNSSGGGSSSGDSSGGGTGGGTGGGSSSHTHIDANNDNVCDDCSESIRVELSFYAVNDLHGKLMDNGNQRGVDEFTTYMKQLYADDEREEILLSSGDMWQGTVESSSNKGKFMTEWMNDVGFVSMTLGNHEYDWGSAVLTPNSQMAEFPFLAINVTYNGKPVDYCQASTTVVKSGVKIGIIGAIGDCLSSISGDFTAGLNFATDTQLTNLVKAESQRLRNEEGCDFIVYSIHAGGTGFDTSGINDVSNGQLSYYDTALSDGYVDLVFEGHTHQRYILKDEYGVFHMQGGGENSYISCADVTYDKITKSYTVSPKLISNNTYANSSIEDDPIIENLFRKYFPDGNPYTDVLGYNATTRNEEEITTKLAELYYRKGVEVWGDYVREQYGTYIVVGGGYLNTRSPYNIYAGNVHYADIFSVLPFDNEIVLGKISGSKLKSQFLNNKNYSVYSTINANAVNDNSYYYIVVDSYSSTYRYNGITEIKRLEGEIYPRDLLKAFIASGGWAN